MMAYPDSFFNSHPEGKALLERFIEAVEIGQAPEVADMDELATAFKKILQGESPKKALNLQGKQSQGQKEKSIPELFRHEFKIAHDILKRSKGNKKRTIELSKKAAIANQVSERTVSNWLKKYLPFFIFYHTLSESKSSLEHIEKYFGDEYAEVIKDLSNSGLNQLSLMVENAKPSEINQIKNEFDGLKRYRENKK